MIITMTARKFEILYKKHVDISTDVFLRFLKDHNLWIIVRWIIKKRLINLFGNVYNNNQYFHCPANIVIHFTSELPLHITRMINSINFPYCILDKQILKCYYTPINDEYTIRVLEDFENKLKGIGLIDDCLLIKQIDNSLILYVTMDYDYCEINQINQKEFHRIVQDKIDYLNSQILEDLNIKQIRVLNYDFEYRDEYDRIRRDMYDENWVNQSLRLCESFLSE